MYDVVCRYQLAKTGIYTSQSTLTLAQRRVIAEVGAPRCCCCCAPFAAPQFARRCDSHRELLPQCVL